jgi:hypothetical protein
LNNNSENHNLENQSEFAPGSIKTPMVAIDWFRAAPWWRLLTSVLNVSWRSSHVLFCAAGLLATDSIIRLCNLLFRPEPGIVTTPSWILADVEIDPPMHFLGVWGAYFIPLAAWFASPTLRGTAFAIALTLGIVAIWSFIGGCLVRRTVLECGAQVSAPWSETLRLVRSRWLSIAWSVTMPACMVLVLAMVPWILGWLSNIPWLGTWGVGLLMLPVVIGSLGIGWCAAITLLGFPLSVAAVVTEKKADAFDGVSRSAAYAFQKPTLLFLLVTFLYLISLISGDVFTVIVGAGYGIISKAFDMGSYGSLDELGAFPTSMFRSTVMLLLSAFSFSFFWSATAVIYLILRRDVDHVEFDQIDLDLPVSNHPKIASNEPAMLPNEAE